jgi:hypothetical protein
MKNLKFFTCKRHNAFIWKNPWIDIKLHDLNFKTKLGLKICKIKQNKKNQTIMQRKLKVNGNVI